MIDWTKRFLNSPFNLLNNNIQKLFLILFCGIFSIGFLTLFNPFNISKWTFSLPAANELPLATFGIMGMVVLAFTQFGLRSWLNLSAVTVGKYLLIVILELALITVANYLIFGEAAQPFIGEFFSVFKHTFLVLALPYSIALLLLSFWNLKKKISQEEVLQKEDGPTKIHLKEENNKIVLSVASDKIVLIKSEGNYLSVHYWLGDSIKKKIIRSNLKTMEAELVDKRFLRVHRSYMVNLDKIMSVDRKKRSYSLILEGMSDVSIPVSNSLKPHFEKEMGMHA